MGARNQDALGASATLFNTVLAKKHEIFSNLKSRFRLFDRVNSRPVHYPREAPLTRPKQPLFDGDISSFCQFLILIQSVPKIDIIPLQKPMVIESQDYWTNTLTQTQVTLQV